MNNPHVSSSFFLFDWLGHHPLESSVFGGVFIFSVTFYTVKSHSICACQCGESHLMFLHLPFSNQEHPVHLLAFLPFLLHEAHDQSWFPLSLLLPGRSENLRHTSSIRFQGMILMFLLCLGRLRAFAFLFTASDVCVVDISKENIGAFDNSPCTLREQGIVLFLQSEYRGNKIEIKYFSFSKLRLHLLLATLIELNFWLPKKQAGLFSDPCGSLLDGRFYPKIVGQVLSKNLGTKKSLVSTGECHQLTLLFWKVTAHVEAVLSFPIMENERD